MNGVDMLTIATLLGHVLVETTVGIRPPFRRTSRLGRSRRLAAPLREQCSSVELIGLDRKSRS